MRCAPRSTRRPQRRRAQRLRHQLAHLDHPAAAAEPAAAHRGDAGREGRRLRELVRRLSTRIRRTRTSFQLRGERRPTSTCIPSSCCRRTSARRSTRRAPARSSARPLAKRFSMEGRRQDPDAGRRSSRNKASGETTWTFDLVGIFKAGEEKQRGLENQLLFRWNYFDEGRTFGGGTIGWYIVRVNDPNQADRRSPRRSTRSPPTPITRPRRRPSRPSTSPSSSSSATSA